MPSRARVCMERACARVIVCDSRCVKEQERRGCRVARRGEVEGREIDRPQDALESFLDTKMAEKIVRSSTSRAATFFSLFSLFFFFLFSFSFFPFLLFSFFLFPPHPRFFVPPPPPISVPFSLRFRWRMIDVRKRNRKKEVRVDSTKNDLDDFPRREIPFGVQECHFAQRSMRLLQWSTGLIGVSSTIVYLSSPSPPSRITSDLVTLVRAGLMSRPLRFSLWASSWVSMPDQRWLPGVP